MFYVRSTRSLYSGQKIPDLRGCHTILGATVAVDPSSRRSNAVRFKYCAAESAKRGCVAHVSGPLALLNGACVAHANCCTKTFDEVEVQSLNGIEKHSELTICYDSDGAVDVVGADEAGIRCGFQRCKTKIIK